MEWRLDDPTVQQETQWAWARRSHVTSQVRGGAAATAQRWHLFETIEVEGLVAHPS